MTPDNEHGFAPLKPVHQVESLGHIGERVERKKEQENKRRKKRKQKRKLEEELLNDKAKNSDAKNDGHIDFRA
ncbi:MAG: hypothetical protein ACYTFK_04745 [Planctomycetota bacterium]|jgi:hypothetical protein